tara:strand:- start:1344 stop:1766 length:423 start_codon:yes stop_codon:yes gene_type:complete
MESIRKNEGEGTVQKYYWELGRRIHHDKDFMDFELDEVLTSIGVSTNHLEAFGDSRFDEEIRARMDIGLSLAGDDIGTPIIGFERKDGEMVGIFGPVITRVPDKNQSLELWDSVITLTNTPGFWELKRTRTEKPEFGERP